MGGVIVALVSVVWLWVGVSYIDKTYCTPALSIDCHRTAVLPSLLPPLPVLSFVLIGYGTVVVFFVVGIYYFLIGVVIGWLYGKIKNRKSSTLNPTS